VNKIKEHIKNGQFDRVYLLYGTESYLKRFYRKKLCDAVLEGGDAMNLSYFQGKRIDEKEVIEIANTLPFFAKRRAVVVEESGWLKAASGMADYIPELPSTTVLIFVESEVDKRNRLYKAVNKCGTISELNLLEEKELKLWVASRFKQTGKKITGQTIQFLLERVGTQMEKLENEIEKIACYALEREVITDEDVKAVCTEQASNKVFQMMEAVGMKNQKRVMQYYYDLLALREKPGSILFLTNRHFNLLMQAKELGQLQMDSKTIAAKMGVPPFSVGRYLAQAKNFPLPMLREALEYGTQLEEEVKTGRIQEQIAVEVLLLRYSA